MKTANLILAIPLLMFSLYGFAEEKEEDADQDQVDVNLEPSEAFWEQLRLNDILRGEGPGGGTGGSSGGSGTGPRGDGQFDIPPLKSPGPTGGRCFSGWCGGWRINY